MSEISQQLYGQAYVKLGATDTRYAGFIVLPAEVDADTAGNLNLYGMDVQRFTNATVYVKVEKVPLLALWVEQTSFNPALASGRPNEWEQVGILGQREENPALDGNGPIGVGVHKLEVNLRVSKYIRVMVQSDSAQVDGVLSTAAVTCWLSVGGLA